MMTRIAEAVGAVVVLLGIVPLTVSADQTQNSFAVGRFNQQVAAYMVIRRSVEERVGVPPVSSNASDIIAMQTALAHALRAARPHTQEGDFFSAEVSVEFRRRILHALERRGVSEGGLLADFRRDSPETVCTPSVNGTFDWRFGAMMPTAVIDALPDLPWPLQYRFVCRDLVLLDVDAGLIVDILPNALTEP
jgi:hypothetical protein